MGPDDLSGHGPFTPRADPAHLLPRLERIGGDARTVEAALSSGTLEAGTAAAEDLVTATSELLTTLDHDPGAPGELVAALRVYRNAAFVFRRLAADTRGLDPRRVAACAAMIGQGHDHLRAIVGPDRATPDCARGVADSCS
jgi:hypothetical protein